MPPRKYTNTAITAMMPKTAPGPTPCSVGSAPPHAAEERTMKKYAHSAGSVPIKEVVTTAASGSFSHRNDIVVDFRL